jgi:hypothetical protein
VIGVLEIPATLTEVFHGFCAIKQAGITPFPIFTMEYAVAHLVEALR